MKGARASDPEKYLSIQTTVRYTGNLPISSPIPSVGDPFALYVTV
jgi:hypothetical protein